MPNIKGKKRVFEDLKYFEDIPNNIYYKTLTKEEGFIQKKERLYTFRFTTMLKIKL